MESVLKVLGWLIFAACGLALFLWIEPANQRVAVIVAFEFLFFWCVSEWLKQFSARVESAIERIERKLQALDEHPLNSRHMLDGLEGLVDEHNQRNRTADDDDRMPVPSISQGWPFGR